MAIGGTVHRGSEPRRLNPQWGDVAGAARAIAAVANDHTVVVTTAGSGVAAPPSELKIAIPPQFAAMFAAGSGNPLEHALHNEMPGRKIASLGIEVMAKLVPTGPRYADTIDGRRFAAEFGWVVAQKGTTFRQCVPSPGPQQVVQLSAVNTLIDAGVLVLCLCGQEDMVGYDELQPSGGQVVLDTDLAAALLAELLHADLLMLLTDVERVEVDWRPGTALPLGGATTVDALRRISYTPWLIGPKVEAACRFVESTGKRAAIGAIADAPEILLGGRGVQVTAPTVP